MGKSFQDQLLKSGLVNKQQLNESKSGKHKKKKHKKPKNSPAEDQQKHALTEQQLQQRAKDLELNLRVQAQRAKKALDSEIKQLISANMVTCEDGDIVYKFSEQGKIRQIYVSTKVQNDLAADRLQIVVYQNSYAVIPTLIATTILERNPDYAVIKNMRSEPEDENYADYQVPDDLIW
jgi:uncharacterized protein YaiL (DUF2058 family)